MAEVIGYVAIGFAYFLGAVVSAVFLSRIGQANHHTIGASWTGDNTLDIISVVIWPASFFIAAAIAFGSVLASIMVRRS